MAAASKLPPGAWRIAALLFGSGLSALVYQVVWEREFRLVFGTSTAASAAVVAIFIGGLGAGGLLFGRRADRHPRPLLLYARLETAIAAAAAATPFLLRLARWAYVAAGGTPALGIVLGTAVRLLLAMAVMALPCVLMGGTLPAASRAAEAALDTRRRGVALLYGVNTLGAVTGALLATFLLLERAGTRGTLAAACAVNALVALVAWRMARAAPLQEEGQAPSPGEAAPGGAPRAFVLGAAAVVGFAFFLMELVWFRMLAPLLGGSVFTFGLVLAVALLGIGLGGAAYAAWARERPASLAGFSLTCALEAACIIAPFAAGDRIALLALRLRPGEAGFHDYVAGWAAVAALVVLPAALVAGAQFPLLIALLGRGRREVGRDVGLAYASNTAGAIVGSLAGGFGLLPSLTAPGCWRLVALLLAALGGGAALLAARPRGWPRYAALAVALAAGGCALAAPGPTPAWRHGGIGAGRAGDRAPTPVEARSWLRVQRRATLWEAEGVESSIALQSWEDGLAFAINGKVDGNSRSDAPTQVMGGLLGVILRPQARRALVIGLGTGSTAGWLGRVPEVERVDVVELEPRVVEVARACAPVNAGVLENPKVRILFGDARETLLTSREGYDLVFSEPSNPYRAGIASLFTREFYEAAAARLAPGGIFLQWLQAYEVDLETALTVLATLGSVFPHVEIWQNDQADLVLVGTREPLAHDAGALRERLARQPFADALRFAWRAGSLEDFLGHHLAGDRLARAEVAKGTRIARDDRNPVEFGFARTVGRLGTFDMETLRRQARALGDDRPAVTGHVDWERVEDARLLLYTARGMAPPMPEGGSAGHRQRARAQIHYVHGLPPDALLAWRAQEREPSGLVELALVAEVLADGADAAAEGVIDQLRRLQPAEADAALGRLRARQGRLEEAAAALEAAFARFRVDPWPSSEVMRRAVDVAEFLSRFDPVLASRMLEALRPPFAVGALGEYRLRAALRIAARLDLRTVCVAALAPFEPEAPWEPELLRYRKECYEATGHPAAARAARELELYLEDERRSRGPRQAG